ncbi:activated Cdc42 kinase-like isoform X8 [Neodiprion lecontei]|uniref:non-specific protein-tyrosine kinase n=1 Tax=Neodiprion lecontei TaxID=441921 RepID=A0ABM3FZI1_NEOLC|nr:activated Cdc42 kinase-like isoform X8 [Neodiprion lecontei]
MDSQTGMSRHTGPGLYEFLMEAELQQYYPGIRGDLKVQTTAQLKYVTEEDLNAIGMSKPEMRRLKKYFQKHFPQNYLSKFKKMLLPKREEQTSSTLGVLPEERQDRPPIRVPNKHMIPADAIIVNKELGTGEFGVVQQGVWTNDGERIQVAIKCLSRERMQNNPIEFLKEAAIMHAIDHEHIVRLYGVVLDTNSLMLVTELAPLRSLLECLKEPSLRASFPVLSLCDFAIQISDGMQYLEAKRLIHRDLAARNILVFSKNKVKISDFGLSRALGVGKDYYQTNFNVNLKLPIAWCAPECISYLKFTSASDVWAYGVTLWEMFSYGFQPWAALTGQQILEAIDEPNFQRLEQPECCPKDYFLLMEQCWQHEPAKRPKFSELTHLLPDLKPEQVQAVQDSTEESQLVYRQGDVLTVLDKGTLSGNANWKGVLANGKTGFFNPAHTIAYLGSNLPSNKMGEFTRGDGKNAFSSQRKKIRPDMISSPQGDLKHTGHVGLDGAYFGDVSFLGGKYPHLPRQVVNPYKPHEDVTDSYGQITEEGSGSELARNSARDSRDIQHFHADMIHSKRVLMFPDNPWSDTASDISHLGTPVASTGKAPSVTSGTTDVLSLAGLDHEYHEISDEESHDSPLRFDKPLNFDFGPSLLDEMDQMFRSLGSSPPPPPPPPPPAHPLPSEHDSSNVRNELREIQSRQSGKKKQATVSPINVKPISAADQRTLYSAIAMAQELTARSMTDLEHPPESPRTPVSPSRRRKFSFKLPHQHSPKPDRRHFAEEAASIPDIQATLSDEAKEVYNSLVETPVVDTATDANPLRMLRSGLPIVRQTRSRGNKHHATMGHHPAHSLSEENSTNHNSLQFDLLHHSGAKTLPKIRGPPPSVQPPPVPTTAAVSANRTIGRHYSVSEIENNRNRSNVEENPIPLPPRDRSKTWQPKSSLARHQRKHPLIIPGGGVTRTLAKVAAVTTPPCDEDHVDGSKIFQLQNAPVIVTEHRNLVCNVQEDIDHLLAPAPANSPEEFEQRIDSELAALDSLPFEENKLQRYSVISEDLLEFSDNLIDCDSAEVDPVGVKNVSLDSAEESLISFPPLSTGKSQSPIEGSTVIPVSVTPIEPITSSIDRVTETGWAAGVHSSAGVGRCTTTSRIGKKNHAVQDSSLLVFSEPIISGELISSDSGNAVNSENSVNSVNSHRKISQERSSASSSSSSSVTRTSDLSRQSDHVSCEDLLEFACDGPNVRRTRGPRNGEQSDEVRIMMKVLHEQSTPESCVEALNVSDWDVLAAIKLERLQGLLRKENNFVRLEDCKVMLGQCGGDVVKAAALLRNTEDTAAV